MAKELTAKDKQLAVYTLKVRGLSFGEIQKAYLYPGDHAKKGKPIFASRSGVKKAYDNELARLQKEDLDWRRLNVDRVERIISGLMPDATSPKTASVINQLIRTQAILTGTAKGVVSESGTDLSMPGGTRALPQNTYANWASARDVGDAADIIAAEWEELGDEDE